MKGRVAVEIDVEMMTDMLELADKDVKELL